MFSMGDPVQIKVIAIDDRNGKLKLSRKATMEKPEGYVEPRNDRGRRDDRGGRDRHRGGGGRGRDNDRRGGHR